MRQGVEDNSSRDNGQVGGTRQDSCATAGCDRAAARGFTHCCRTCSNHNGRKHGPVCEASQEASGARAAASPGQPAAGAASEAEAERGHARHAGASAEAEAERGHAGLAGEDTKPYESVRPKWQRNVAVDKKEITIEDSGYTARIGGGFSIRATEPLPKSGTSRWRLAVQFMPGHETVQFHAGVCTDDYTAFDESAPLRVGSWTWHCHRGMFTSEAVLLQSGEELKASFVEERIVDITFNADRSLLAFTVGGVRVGSFRVPGGSKYYPVISGYDCIIKSLEIPSESLELTAPRADVAGSGEEAVPSTAADVAGFGEEAAPLTAPPAAAVQLQGAASRPAAHSRGVRGEESVAYKPLACFVDKPPPGKLKPCSVYVLSDCRACMPEVALLDESVQEVSRIVKSKLGDAAIKGALEQHDVAPAMLFAIVLYTFDLCLIDASEARENNFYFSLNVNLRSRSAEFLRDCHGFLYYLMSGLSRLPAFAGDYLYRGIDSLGADYARAQYTQGRSCHWSGFSSATPELGPSKRFASQSGPGGLILRIKVLKAQARARDIRRYSAFDGEDEVLLLPNFKTLVIAEATMDAHIGLEVIDLIECAEAEVEVY